MSTQEHRLEYDGMHVLREPVARGTCAAVLPHIDDRDRDVVAHLVLTWIDALGPVIASARPPHRWSRRRRRELQARRALEDALAGLDTLPGTPPVVANLLAAGVQVPIAAGAWLLVWLADRAGPEVEPMHAVWETLRLTPPTWITARVATRTARVGEAIITAGELIMVSPLLLGRLTDLVPGDDTELREFDPDRWKSDQVRPGAWLPFGAGPHACPGRTLGLAMLHYLATWAGDRCLTLTADVAVDQTRGIFPSPALFRITNGEPQS